MIRKFGDNKAEVPGSDKPIEVPSKVADPEQKYEGKWQPGANHPTTSADQTGPYAGIVRYLPVPESQIER